MWIVDILAPRSCVFCGVPGKKSEKSICRGCYTDLPWNEPPLSPAPGLFECSVAMLHYSFPVDAAIKAFKFNRKLFYAPAFAEILCSAKPVLPSDVDAILPVPLHWRRKAMRGFNQVTEIAKPLSKLLGLPLARGVCRAKATPYQSGLAARDRARNLRQAFTVDRTFSYAHVLIVDDVITTGATTGALARVLIASGVQKVSVLAVAGTG